jgi:hypothetical protein
VRHKESKLKLMKDTLKKRESDIIKRETVAKEKETEINLKKAALKKREEELQEMERKLDE